MLTSCRWAFVCVHDRKMDEPWCLVAPATVPTPVLIRSLRSKRWGFEAGFPPSRTSRFGMGLSSMHARAQTGGTLLLISALAIAMLSLLGAAGERTGA